MKLAIVTETFPPEVNGVAMTFGVVVRELALRGNEVFVYRPARPDLETRTVFREVPMPGMPVPFYPQLRFGFPAARRLEREWRASPPDLVHVVTEGPLGASAISAARRLGLPVTSSFHTNFHRYTGHYGMGPLRRLTLAWLRRVHNRTERTFAPTPELVAELEAAGFERLDVLSRGIDRTHFSPARRSREQRIAWGASVADPVAIHVGRMAAEKNYGLLLRAYDAMRGANPRMRFVLAGEGPLKAQIAQSHPNFIHAGFLPRDRIGTLYASGDIYIHASITETFGNVLTEAMASGLAVLGFDYAAARQFVRHGENGLVVPPGDETAFIGAAVKLATDAALRDRLRAAAPAALANQGWEQVVSRFEDTLRGIAIRRNRPGGPRECHPFDGTPVTPAGTPSP